MTKKTPRKSSRKQAEIEADRILAVFDTIREKLGVPPGGEIEVVECWARAQMIMDEHPEDALLIMAKGYDIDLKKLAKRRIPVGFAGSGTLRALARK